MSGGATLPAHYSRRRSRALLLAILVVAAAARLARPGHSPPGLHVDAAANAWNAQCLLETGRDWHGKPWPVFYSKGFGENQSTLYYYALMPFQAVLGMSAATSCLPSAIAGILSVLLMYAVGTRLFGRRVGLFAAALLAMAPWHLLLGRWGHESGLVPLLTLLPLWALLRAGLPVGGDERELPRVVPSLAAGLLLGVCCYGYYAMRLFLPALLVALVVLNRRGWRAAVTDRAGRRAVLAFGLGLAVTLGPLLYRHVVDPEIAKRGREFLLWSASDPLWTRAGKVAARYAGHFGTDFLFSRGDVWPLHALPGSGPLPWYTLPLLVLGLAAAAREARVSSAARLVLAWTALYPVADALTRHPSLHLLRSAPGLVGLALVAAVGADRTWTFLASRSRPLATAAAVLLALAIAASAGRFAYSFFGDYDTRRDVRHFFNADLLEASAWLRARLPDADVVFISCRDSAALNQPFVVSLVGLDYEPEQWFGDAKDVTQRPDTDVYRRFGKVHFLFDESDLRAVRDLESNGRPDRAIFVLRPGESAKGQPVHEIRDPDGSVAFEIYEEIL